MEFNLKERKKLEMDQPTAMSDTVPPNMFATDGYERDPVAVYKFFGQEET